MRRLETYLEDGTSKVLETQRGSEKGFPIPLKPEPVPPPMGRPPGKRYFLLVG